MSSQAGVERTADQAGVERTADQAGVEQTADQVWHAPDAVERWDQLHFFSFWVGEEVMVQSSL